MSKKAPILVLLGILIVSSFLYLPAHDLYPDEAHYWAWSRHLDFGYYDNAPMVAYVIRLFTAVFGRSEWAMRLPSWLTYCFLIGLAFLFGRRAYGNSRAGWIAATLAGVVPIYLGANSLITSDTTNVLFSALTVFFAYNAIEGKNPRSWLGVGICFGLALLSKYQAVLAGLSILLTMLVHRDRRQQLKEPHPYCAALLSLLLFLPVMLWNWRHGWLSFCFQLRHGFHGGGGWLGNVLIFLSGQALGFSPLVFLAVLAGLPGALARRRRADTFLLGSSLPVFAFFILTSSRSRPDLQWPIIGVFPLLIFLAGRIDESWRIASPAGRRLLTGYWGLALAIALVLVGLIRYPEFLRERLGVKLEAKAILTNRLCGWKDLGIEVDRRVTRCFPGQEDVPVFVTSYQIGGVVSFYSRSKRITVMAAPLVRRNQFDQYTLADVARFNGKDGLLIAENPGYAFKTVPRFFGRLEPLGTYRRVRYGALLGTYYFYRVDELDAGEIGAAIPKKHLGF